MKSLETAEAHNAQLTGSVVLPPRGVVGKPMVHVEDERVFKSVVSSIMKKWLGGKAEEYHAMEWLSRELFSYYEMRKRR
jgi:hypothetical protein